MKEKLQSGIPTQAKNHLTAATFRSWPGLKVFTLPDPILIASSFFLRKLQKEKPHE